MITKGRALAALLMTVLAPSSLAATTIAMPRPSPQPYAVSQVLPCLEAGDRDACLLRLFVARDGQTVLAEWFEVYGDPQLAVALGIDLSADGALARATNEAGQAYLMDWHGRSPAQALEPFTPLLTSQFGERYIGLELSGLMTLVEMGRDPQFPIRQRPSAALVAEAERRIELGLREEDALTRQQSATGYINLLLNWGDRTTAARIDGLAGVGAPETVVAGPDRVSRQAQVGDLDEAAGAALALKFRPRARGDVQWADQFELALFNRAVADARDMVALEADDRGRGDIALSMARRVIEDACPEDGQGHRPTLGLKDVFSLIIRRAEQREVEEWTERLEACSAVGSDEGRIDAASIAFHSWRRLGRPERAHRITEAWRPNGAAAEAKYEFQPSGFFVAMLLAEGRVDEAISRASPESLFGLTRHTPENIDLILDRLPKAERFGALMSCEMAMRMSDLQPCAIRLEQEASTAAQKLEAAGLLIAVTGAGSPGRYGPWAYSVPADQALIDARFASAGRLLRAAVDAEPQILAAPVEADALRELVRMSLRARLWKARSS